MTGYYDYVLGAIPLTLLGITTLLLGAGFGLTEAVPVGAGASTLVIGHALFVNAPIDPAEATTVTQSKAARQSNPVNAD